ncbi:RNA-directed DNA polymerase, eukaryota, reverse transcriptase zinc-binding domain protein [Tanacetum coccineum]
MVSYPLARKKDEKLVAARSLLLNEPLPIYLERRTSIKLSRKQHNQENRAGVLEIGNAVSKLLISANYFHNVLSNCAGREAIYPVDKGPLQFVNWHYGSVMEIYGPEFLRKPTVTDVEKLYRHHEETHGFPGDVRKSLNCLNVGVEPADDDYKRILYKQKQESARKDVERAFGVLKKK